MYVGREILWLEFISSFYLEILVIFTYYYDQVLLDYNASSFAFLSPESLTWISQINVWPGHSTWLVITEYPSMQYVYGVSERIWNLESEKWDLFCDIRLPDLE